MLCFMAANINITYRLTQRTSRFADCSLPEMALDTPTGPAPPKTVQAAGPAPPKTVQAAGPAPPKTVQAAGPAPPKTVQAAGPAPPKPTFIRSGKRKVSDDSESDENEDKTGNVFAKKRTTSNNSVRRIQCEEDDE
jgi:hypothetical protein